MGKAHWFLGRERKSAAHDVDREIEFHLDETIKEFVSQGMTDEEARRRAYERFGNLGEYRKRLTGFEHAHRRRRWFGAAFDELREDARFAFQTVRRSPWFTLAVALTLATGVGANATMYGVVDRVLMSPPPHIQQPEQVKRLYIEREFLGRQVVGSYITHPDFRDWQSAESFTAVAAFSPDLLTFGDGERARRIGVSFVSGSFFSLLGAPAILGRTLQPRDDVVGAEQVAVISQEFWRSEYGESRDVLGRVIEVGRNRLRIVGVAPRGFTGVDLEPVDVWIPLHANVDVETWEDHRDYYWIQTIARLAPGTSVEQAEAETTLLHRQGRADVARYDVNARVIVAASMAARGPRAPRETTVAKWLAGVSVIVLIIACANVANLLLAHGTRQRREIAVRLALGVSRARLVRQLLAASMLFALIGALGAFGVAQWGGILVGSVLVPDARWTAGTVNIRMLLFTLAVAATTGIVAGIVPALRSSGTDLATTLKNGSRNATARRSKARIVFFIAQAALSVVLLVGAGLFVTSLQRVRSADIGIEPDNLAVIQLEGRDDLDLGERHLDAVARILERLATLPTVQSVTSTSALPFRSSTGEGVRVPGRDSIPRLPSGGPYFQIVTPSYFETLGLTIQRGRGFTINDRRGTPPVTVMNATMARLIWPNDEPLGKCIFMGSDDDTPCVEVVGIVEDAHRHSVIEEEQMLYYVPGAQRAAPNRRRAILVKTRAGTTVDLGQFRREVFSVEPAFRSVRAQWFSTLMDPQLRSWRLGATVFSAFGVLALLVAALGLYSVLAFEVAQRRSEIGVRSALGATSARLVSWVMGDGLRLAGAGLVIGAVAMWFGGQALEPMLYETSWRDPTIYLVVSATLMAVACLATMIPAVRSTRVAPSDALRTE